MSTLFDRTRDDQYDAQYPDIYAMFCRFTSECIHSGAKKLGGHLIVNRIRYEMHLSKGARAFLINNSDIPYLTRRWLRDHPEHQDIFEIRKSREDAA